MSLENLMAVARGERPADLLLTNGRVINVYSGEIVAADIAIADGLIAGFGPRKAARVRDLENRFVAPGFIDAHVHLESTMAVPSEYARAVLPRGTTAVAADPHEIANVLGTAGLDYMLAASNGLPLSFFFTLPSCVPATRMETAGADLTDQDLAPYIRHPRILGLAEMMISPVPSRARPRSLLKLRWPPQPENPWTAMPRGSAARPCRRTGPPVSAATTSAPAGRKPWKNYVWACTSWCGKARGPRI